MVGGGEGLKAIVCVIELGVPLVVTMLLDCAGPRLVEPIQLYLRDDVCRSEIQVHVLQQVTG